METININGTDIEIQIESENGFEVSFLNPQTGLKKVLECEEILIRPKSRMISTKWIAFDETPIGARINRQEMNRVISTEEAYSFFLSVFGVPIKKYAINGLFQQVMARFQLFTNKVYGDDLGLITEQPVPAPEPDPTENIDISDAFTDPES